MSMLCSQLVSAAPKWPKSYCMFEACSGKVEGSNVHAEKNPLFAKYKEGVDWDEQCECIW